MHTRPLLLLALLSLTWPALVAAQPPADKAPDEVVRLTASLRISAASNVLDELQSTLADIDVLTGKAIAAVSPEAAQGPATAEIELDWDTGRRVSKELVVVGIEVTSHDRRVPVEKLLKSFCQLATRKLTDEDFKFVADSNLKVKYQLQTQRMETELNAMDNTYAKFVQMKQLPAAADSAAAQQSRLDTQIGAIEEEIAGLQARMKAIQDQISEAAKAAEGGVQSDPALLELTKAVKYREQLVEIARAAAQAAKVTQGQVATAQIELAHSQFELAKYRRELVDSTGGKRVADLQARLGDSTVELAAANAQLARLTIQREALLNTAELDILRMRRDVKRQAYRATYQEFIELSNRLEMYQSPSLWSNGEKIEKGPKKPKSDPTPTYAPAPGPAKQ